MGVRKTSENQKQEAANTTKTGGGGPQEEPPASMELVGSAALQELPVLCFVAL